MQNFIAEEGSVLLAEKLHGTISCKQWLDGGEIRGFIAKIRHYVISDVIKTGLLAVLRDITRGTEVDG